MKCEEVRPLLADMAGGVSDRAAEVEDHLGSCAACSAELGRYRATMLQLSALREDLAKPPAGAVERALARVPAWRWRLLARRAMVDERVRYTALSLGEYRWVDTLQRFSVRTTEDRRRLDLLSIQSLHGEIIFTGRFETMIPARGQHWNAEAPEPSPDSDR